MDQALLGTGVRNSEKNRHNSWPQKVSFQRSRAGAANYVLWAKSGTPLFRGKQSHFIYISSVPFHTAVAVLAKTV